MPFFEYSGRAGDGSEARGVLEAATAGAAADQLVQRGIRPTRIVPGRAPAKGLDLGAVLAGFSQPKILPVDVMLFTRQLHTLLRAGVPILRALAGLQESMSNRSMQAVVQDVRDNLQGGRELSACFARHPRIFTPFYVSMVRVGEMTGLLEEIFIRLYEHLDFERFMREQVKSALRYPSFVILAMGVAIVVVNLFVIPAFAKVFAGFKVQLPLMTRMLIGFSDFMQNYWYVMLGGVVAAVFAFRSWTSTPAGLYQWDRIKMRIPIAGTIVQKATLARFARSFALAFRSGVPVIQGLSNVALTVDNAYVAKKIEAMRETVERGDTVLRAAVASGIFTPVVLQMIAVGEESGALDEMMGEVAEMYQREVEYELKTLAQQIEPILIVFLGALVLVLALGIFLPLWDLGKAAKGG
jgi:MSHA biogenesis protein MshG